MAIVRIYDATICNVAELRFDPSFSFSFSFIRVPGRLFTECSDIKRSSQDDGSAVMEVGTCFYKSSTTEMDRKLSEIAIEDLPE